MGWQVRGRRRYYTRSRKVNGRVKREYVGCGAEAELAAALDAARRSAREAQRKAARAERARLAGADSLVLSFCELAELLMRASLLTSGCHQHARGRWRR